LAEITGQKFNSCKNDERDDKKRNDTKSKPLKNGFNNWMQSLTFCF
jgi:hypothetical protein